MKIRKLIRNKTVTRAMFVVAGAGAGFAYYHFIGCASGTCPITGNPYASTMYGGVMGFMLAMVKEN